MKSLTLLKNPIRMALTVLCLLFGASNAFALDARGVIPGGDYADESDPNDPNRIQASGGGVHWIQSGTWVRYDNLSFGPEPVIQIRIKAAAPSNGGDTIRVRHGSLNGPVIATVVIPGTGDWGAYRDSTAGVDPSFTPSGDRNRMFFEFTGGSGVLMNMAEFSFATSSLLRRPDLKAGDFLQESGPNDPAIIDKDGSNLIHITDNSWVDYGRFDFDAGMTYAWIEVSASTDSPKGVARMIQFRTGSKDGPIIGSVEVPNTGGLYKPLPMRLASPVAGVKHLFLTFDGGTGNLFKISKFRFQRVAPDYKPTGLITARVERDETAAAVTPAGGFNQESHPNQDYPIRPINGVIENVQDGSWFGFLGYNFGADGVNHVTMRGATPEPGGTLELRLGNPKNGKLIGTVNIGTTGGWSNFTPFQATLKQAVTGVHDLYFRSVNGGFFNVADFRFQQLFPELKSKNRWVAAQQFDQESNPGVDTISGADGITSVTNGTWVAYQDFNFGEGSDLLTVAAATPNKGGLVEVRLDSINGPLITAIDVTYTGSFTHYRPYTQRMTQTVSGTHHLYLKFVDTHGQRGHLFNLRNFIVEKKATVAPAPSDQGSLVVYDPVRGLDPSPYYSYSVQKVSALNAPLKQNATNWLTPFAWFTECRTSSEPYSGSYYSHLIGGWSHTYCNFELGKNTPVVVKITRKNSNPHGAPAGRIFMANAHPAHKVLSCEIINGEVYVTMKEPALVTIDIDGQMDTRDVPHGPTAFNNRQNGSHAVSIFANPVISDKPAAPAANPPESGAVLYITPGGNAKQKMSVRNDWTTAYFLPGVHSFSGIAANGQPNKWEPGDQYTLPNDKTIYLPGDAMLYGNFVCDALRNFRIYGLGSISGRHIPHHKDSSWSTYPGWDAQNGAYWDITYKTMPLEVTGSLTNCHFEGISLVDPSFHGISALFGSGNSKKWHKLIGWRANTDMGGPPGIIEDCFFRLQDDGLYVGYNDFRRNTLWFDVNGEPFRGSFMTRDAWGDGGLTVMEDCDIIYARSFAGGSVINVQDEGGDSGTYPDGTRNTAQHLVFRNIRLTDHRPNRSPFQFKIPAGLTSGVSGIRFENLEFRHPHTWGWNSQFHGAATKPITHLYFDGVTIEGKKLTQALFNDPSLFQSSYTSNLVFRDAPIDTKLRTAAKFAR